ncbi:MAG: SGNH/GDSL hydrolase family protein [Bacteroidales bacterium]|nr:SGNH/GDSL hydrolase family protein [Bacteroidales bacterium]
MDRRLFFKQVSATAALLTLSNVTAISKGIEKKESKTGSGRMLQLENNDTIVFTGDSITDGFREYKYYRVANSIRALGNGYVELVASKLNYTFPNKNLKIYNTGINGDTIVKVLARLNTDVLDLKPTVVSILLGVNDFNVAFSATGKGTPDVYETQYRELLTKIKTALPNVRFVLGEPYAIKGVREKIDVWYPEFNAYREVAKKMAEEFKAVFIPYQLIYEAAVSKAPKSYFTTDGIHPSLAGLGLVADAWFSYVDVNKK